MPAIRATNPHARRLRRDATDVEQRLWLALRNRRLDGFKFRRQATIGPFVVDLLCAERRLVIELDGGQHNPAQDTARTEFIKGRGYRLIRFWNNDVLENWEGVLQAIRIALDETQGSAHSPSPNPLPQAGEGQEGIGFHHCRHRPH